MKTYYDEIEILPGYVHKKFRSFDGEDVMPDSVPHEFWAIMCEQGLKSKLWFDGEGPQDKWGFSGMCHQADTHIWFSYYEGEPAGFFWLNGFTPKTAHVHQCFFKVAWGKFTVEASRLTTDLILHAGYPDTGEHMLDALIGLTPADNKLAIRLLKKAGFKVVGTVPNGIYKADEKKSYPAVLSAKTRDDIVGG